MLVVVLLLMLVGFGMLVVASVTATSALAWVSVAASVLGAAVLVGSWRRKAVIAADEQQAARAALEASRWSQTPAGGSVPAAPGPELTTPPASQSSPFQPVASQPAVSQRPVWVPRGPEPGEQHRDPVSGVLGAMLDRQVLVVDEQPAYHLPGCPVLSGRQAVGLTVKDAIGLDFTPCAVCTPLRVLASATPTHENLAGRQQ